MRAITLVLLFASFIAAAELPPPPLPPPGPGGWNGQRPPLPPPRPPRGTGCIEAEQACIRNCSDESCVDSCVSSRSQCKAEIADGELGVPYPGAAGAYGGYYGY